MISYSTKNWIHPLTNIYKTSTFKRLFWALIGVGAYTLLIYYLEIFIFKLSKSSHISNITVMHSILGFAISMVLVFRTNTAYDRWWEGRKLWGALVNNSRNLAIKISIYLPDEYENDRQYFKILLEHFPDNLRLHLQAEKTRLALDSLPHPEIKDFDISKHVPSQMVDKLMSRLYHLQQAEILTAHQLWLMNAECQSFLDITGACERIKNTPIPYSYSSFIKIFVAIYIFTLPFAFVFTLGWLCIPVVMFIFYILASLEIIAEEIEEPFGTDENDLPMERMCAQIKRNVDEIFSMKHN